MVLARYSKGTNFLMGKVRLLRIPGLAGGDTQRLRPELQDGG